MSDTKTFAIDLAYIEITSRCNLNCRSCYNAVSRQAAGTEMPLDSLRRIIENLKRIGCRRVVLSGGEPTLHSRFTEILSLVERHHDLRFGIVTNGVQLPPSLESLISDGLPLDIQVSLDGSCEEVNARTRGPGAFAPAWETAKRLAVLSDNVRCKLVLSQLNQADLEAFYERVLSIHAKPEFGLISRMGNAGAHWDSLELSPTEKAAVLQRLNALNDRFHQEVVLPACTFGCPYLDYPDASAPLSLLIKADGTIQPCQTLYDERYTVGSMLHFDQAAFSKSLQDFSSLVRKRLALDWNCRVCIARAACRKGCPAGALSLSGDPLGNDGDCQLRRILAVNALVHRREEVQP